MTGWHHSEKGAPRGTLYLTVITVKRYTIYIKKTHRNPHSNTDPHSPSARPHAPPKRLPDTTFNNREPEVIR